MSNCYKLSYSCSKKRLNDLIHKGLEYEKEHGLEQPEKETIIVRKDQRIAELEKGKQTAVKEFANEIIKMLNKYSIKGTIKICDNVIENNINLILKERGLSNVPKMKEELKQKLNEMKGEK